MSILIHLVILQELESKEGEGGEETEGSAIEKEVGTVVRTNSVADVTERARGESTSLSFLAAPTEKESSQRKIDLDSEVLVFIVLFGATQIYRFLVL